MAGKRKFKLTDILAFVLLGLLIFGLAGFGVTSFGSNAQAIAKVGEAEVSAQDYYRELQNELDALSSRAGQPISLNDAIAVAQIDQVVLRRLMARAALQNAVDTMGVSVGDNEVAKQIRDYPAFQGQNGAFDRNAYEYALENAGLKVEEFEATIRRDQSRALLERALGAGITAPDTYARTLQAYITETRSLEWAKLTTADLAQPLPAPTDADLTEYYTANPADFTTPETRQITYAWVAPTMILDEVTVEDSTLQQFYNERITEFQIPERRLIERLVYLTDDEAAAAKARIDAGETLEELAAERGLTLGDLDMGDVAQADLGDAGAAIFAAEMDQIIGPLPSDLGPALYRVNGVLEAQNTTLDEVRDDLRSEYAEEAARDKIATEMGAIDDLLAAGATLEELAADTLLQLGTLDYGPQTDADITGYDEFRAAAGAAQQGDFPELIELSDGGVFALRLDGITPAQLQPQTDVADAVLAGWQAQSARAALRRQAEALDPNTSFSAQGLIGITEIGLPRDAAVDGAPEALVIKGFETATGEIAILDGAEDDVFVLRVVEILPADLEDPLNTQTRALLNIQVQSAVEQDIFGAMASALQTKAGIEIDQAAINAVHAQIR
jgi:peptidyl-prolyl cis-trans isomerase D